MIPSSSTTTAEGDGKKRVILWIVAFCITVGSAAYQRITGPTFPVFGNSTLGGNELQFRFDRSHGGESGAPIGLDVPDSSIAGILEWKHEEGGDSWISVPMVRRGGRLEGELPPQPPASRVRYRVTLVHGPDQVVLPGEAGIVLRYKAEVPLVLLVAHIVLMFGAMLLSTRAGLECFRPAPSLKKLTVSTTILLVLGGIVLGALVQEFAFGVYWTGWPAGNDMTDNKTAIALAGWVVACLVGTRPGRGRGCVIAASTITFVVFLIPHSILS